MGALLFQSLFFYNVAKRVPLIPSFIQGHGRSEAQPNQHHCL